MLNGLFGVAALALYAFFETDREAEDSQAMARLARDGVSLFAGEVLLLGIRHAVLGAGLWTRSLDFLALPFFCVLRNRLKEDRVFTLAAAGFWFYLISFEWKPLRAVLSAGILAGGWAAARLILIGLDRRLQFLHIPQIFRGMESEDLKAGPIFLVGAGILWMAIEALF